VGKEGSYALPHPENTPRLPMGNDKHDIGLTLPQTMENV